MKKNGGQRFVTFGHFCIFHMTVAAEARIIYPEPTCLGLSNDIDMNATPHLVCKQSAALQRISKTISMCPLHTNLSEVHCIDIPYGVVKLVKARDRI